MHLVLGLLTHAATFWAVVWLTEASSFDGGLWLLCYAAGAASLVAGRWVPRLVPNTAQAFQVVAYAGLLALVFWGANEALDVLGNSVPARRLPPELRMGLPLHLFLVPGVASAGLGAMVAAAWRQRCAPQEQARS